MRAALIVRRALLLGAALVAAAAACAQPPGGELLRELTIRGNTVVTTTDLLTAAAPWLGERATPADLEALRIELTRVYVQRGYVNSGARLDPAGVVDGRLGITIVEGRLSAIRVTGLDGLDERYLTVRLWPAMDQTLDMNALRERYQLLLDDPLVRRMNAKLVPDDAPGSATLEVEIERAPPWALTLRASNHRPASLGEALLGADYVLRNLSGRGDALRLHYEPDTHARRFGRAAIGWTVPLRPAGPQLALLLDDGESTMVQEPLAALGVRSKLTQAEIGLQQVLLEQLRHRAATGLVLAWRRNRTWIGDVPFPFVAGVPDEGLRTRDLRWWQEFTWRAEQTVLALRSTFSATRTNLEPLAPEAAVQPSARDYARWLGQAQLGQRIGDAGLQAVARVTLQAATKRMLAIDGLAIGGAASVRGFAENTLIRDRGSLVNLELEIPVLRSAARNAMLQVVPFADHGRGHNIGGRTDSLGSIGVALRGRVDRFAGELAWGKRVHSTVGKERTGDSLQDHGFHLQVSYTFGGNP